MPYQVYSQIVENSVDKPGERCELVLITGFAQLRPIPSSSWVCFHPALVVFRIIDIVKGFEKSSFQGFEIS